MTFLAFTVNPEAVMLMTDTLVSDLDGDPRLFTTKAALLPHLDVVAATTGSGNMADAWRMAICQAVVARDFDSLDRVTPDVLRALADDIDPPFTTTIHHFGYSEQRGRYAGRVYRSVDDFDGDDLPADGVIRLKPGLVDENGDEVPDDRRIDDLDGFIAAAEDRRRAFDERCRRGDTRVAIGGDLVVIWLQAGSMHVERRHRFPGYEDQWRSMHEHAYGAPPPEQRRLTLVGGSS